MGFLDQQKFDRIVRSVEKIVPAPKPMPPKNEKVRDFTREQARNILRENKGGVWGKLHKFEEISESGVPGLEKKWFKEKLGPKISPKDLEKAEKELEKSSKRGSSHERFTKKAELDTFRELFVKKEEEK